jgi:hypothetical protein
MAAANELYPDTLQAAVNAVITPRSYSPETERLSELEESLSQSPDERLRRIALAALMAQSGRPRGWTSARRARLRVYQEDPSPLVAAVAQFTFPSEEAPAAEG